MKSLMQGRREGKYWKDCDFTIKALFNLSLSSINMKEKDLEDHVARFLSQQKFPSGEQFFDHRIHHDLANEITLFSSVHRPDMSIGRDGTAIEVKTAENGNKVKQAISQALFYRTGYRFVIVLLVDSSPQGDVFASMRKRGNTQEVQLLGDLEKYMNIFIIPRSWIWD